MLTSPVVVLARFNTDFKKGTKITCSCHGNCYNLSSNTKSSSFSRVQTDPAAQLQVLLGGWTSSVHPYTERVDLEWTV